MALSAKTNQIVGPAATGDSATTDPGFQPKALLMWAGLQTAVGGVADAQFSLGVGSSSTTEKAAGYNSDDNTASSDVARDFRTGEVLRLMTAGTATGNVTATLTSLDATGFTPNFTTVTTASPLYNYLALGGTDITNVFSGHVASNTATGNQAVTGVGFQPDIVIMFGTLQTANGSGNNNSQYSFGVMTPTAQWSTAVKSANAQATMNTSRAFYDNKCFTMIATASDTVFQQMSYVSMDADGFTFNIDTAGGTAILLGYICIKGGQWKVGTETQKTSTGTKATTGIGFTPSGVILSTVCDTGTAAVAANSRFCFGASTGAGNNVSVWTGDRDNVADSIANTIMSSSKCIVMATEGTSGTPTIQAEANIDSFSSDTFTLNWTTADATARQFGYIAFGTSAISTSSDRGLYTAGIAISSSDRNIYTQAKLTDASDRLLYTAGVATSLSDRGLYTSGVAISLSDRNLYIQGKLTSSSDRLLYLEGKPASQANSSDRNLHIQGKITTSSDRGLYLGGIVTSSSDRGLYTQGKLTNSSDRLLYIAGKALGSSDRGLYIQGKSTSESDRGLYTTGINGGLSDRNLYTQGQSTGNSERGLYITGSINAYSERLLRIAGKATASSDRGLYMAGISTSSSGRNLYTQGKLTSSSDRGLYTSGATDGSSDRGLYIGGYVVSQDHSDRGIVIAGSDSDASDRLLYIVGGLIGSSDRGLWTSGLSGDTSSRGLYIDGKQDSTSERGLYSIGKESSFSDRGIIIEGKLSDNSSRGLWIFGGNEWTLKERGLWIRGQREATTFDIDHKLYVFDVQKNGLNVSIVQKDYVFGVGVVRNNISVEQDNYIFTVTK